jgi:hypothetical protein
VRLSKFPFPQVGLTFVDVEVLKTLFIVPNDAHYYKISLSCRRAVNRTPARQADMPP